jgi:hypothetical protein
MTRSIRLTALAVASAFLAACGGGDDSTAAAGGNAAAGGTLTLSAAAPADHNTTVNSATATTRGNLTRAADGFSAQPYCEVFWENANGANGKKYALQVYFRQSDKAALHVSVLDTTGGAPTWVVFDNNSGNPVTGVTVDTAARTVTFAAKALADGQGAVGTVNGSVAFPANAGTAACGQ